jgi:predicted  nucleic acid-binding Zn-ribbon protein
LKERIHKIQAEYYQQKLKTPTKGEVENNDEDILSNIDGSVLENKLDSLQNALETLEARFEQKEHELQCLSEICHSLEGQNKLLQEQLSQSNEIIGEQDSQLDSMREEVGYFKEKMGEMQVVIDQCGQQMMDFDQINRMSS